MRAFIHAIKISPHPELVEGRRMDMQLGLDSKAAACTFYGRWHRQSDAA
jgi:hypothetical protein